ncbi:hypothetical protein [Mucilaginibacter pedocola]|uniref:Uncharacterized protein n=1 Tax=Mucilaginibacter pedocola TaxID=1792845 RepID=A0A1S9P8D9_9SPHI|nr:hypothetical protein [Mucilaginibacter pedocola]OOQ57240.1 hypothetical protein BC343_14070 [Mucilaginibacter pedocola]
MFEKLYSLVENNAGTAVINNPLIAPKFHAAVINDATSSIIEVIKSQLESGKLKDLVKYFQLSGVYDNPLINSAVNKFAIKLDKYYDIPSVQAKQISNELIRPVMQELIRQSKTEQNKEFALTTLLSKISGQVADMGLLIAQLKIA